MSILEPFVTGLPPPPYLNSRYYHQQVQQDISHLRFIQLFHLFPGRFTFLLSASFYWCTNL